MKKYIIGSLIVSSLLLMAGNVDAASRNLPGVSIVTRSEWGADENRKYSSRAEYVRMVELAEEREKYMTEAEKEKAEHETEKSQVSRAYALEHFPQDILIDTLVRNENGNDLWRNQEYKYQKTKILVHHTVNDITKIKNETDMKILLRSVYSHHAFSNGWGDVGYNFIISPGGVIYEGRSGGEGVVGAHATWNNQPSVGIALVGNFNVDKPTQAQIDALTSLITELSRKYNINPQARVNYHKKSSAYPYVATVENYALASHRDVGATACPGENLYKLLPAIRDRVATNLLSASNYTAPAVNQSTPPATAPSVISSTLTLPSAYNITTDVYLIRTKTSNMGTTLPRCQIQQGDITISGCMYRNGELIIGVKKKNGNLAPGLVSIKATSRNATVSLSLNLSRLAKTSAALPTLPTMPTTPSLPLAPLSLLQQRKANFPLTMPYATKKITSAVSAGMAPTLMKNNVSVLLYNASMLSSSWTFTCTGTCSMNGSTFTTLNVSFSGGMLSVQKNGLVWKETSLTLSAVPESTISVLDGVSKKQYGVYRGSISLKQQSIKKIDGNYVSQYAVINTLPLEQYLAGMAEASDKEPIEKTKVLALLTKAYALYYVGGSGPHPSIPKGAAYQAIDDPRFFQKYVGVTREKASKNWPIAIAATKNQYVVYNNTLPILPYFHCSAGFTRAAREKRGWTDTPYLQSVLDESGCTTFEGHGVGLSGQGATKKAQNGEKAEEIITYYYPGVQVITNY